MIEQPTPAAFEVTPESFARWLQAQRPGDWFFTLAEEEQLALAEQGVIQRLEASIDAGYAMRDPELFEAQLYADEDPEAAEVLTRRLAAATVANLLGTEGAQDAPQSPGALAAPSLAGIIDRRQAAHEEALQGRVGRRRFLGRLPDAAAPDERGVGSG